MENDFFDQEISLPSDIYDKYSAKLIGFNPRYDRVHNHLQAMLSSEDISSWSKKHHKQHLPICDTLSEKYPIFIFSGDVGTGKTIMAQCMSSRISSKMKKEGFLLKLSTRVRGQGLHGQMSQLIHEAFSKLEELAGKKRLAFLLIDEADSLTAQRTTKQMHQEEKAAVNTIIQKMDDIKKLKGRIAVFLCTNRLDVLDPAVVRRAVLCMEFNRPNDAERRELLNKDLNGLDLSPTEIDELVNKTGPIENQQAGYSFSDFRTRMLPEAVVQAFSKDVPLNFDILREAIDNTNPSPEV